MSRIVVVTKSTPDTAARVEVNASGAVTWGDAQMVINPWDEYSVTEAVLLKEAHVAQNVKTTILAVGPELHNDALKQGLAIGIDDAVRVWDAGMDGQDSLGYATVVAAAIRKLGDVSLILFGRELVDVVSDAHIFQVARKLGWTTFGSVSKIAAIDFAASSVRVERVLEEGKQTLSGSLPCVVSVLKEINDPRYPSFINIRKASKAVIPVWSAVDLGLDPVSVSGAAAKVKTTAYHNLPARAGSVQIIQGANETEKARNLVARLIEEKIL